MRWIFFLFSSFPLFAAYIGNPADPALMNTGIFSTSYPFVKFTTGYIGDYISDKRYVTHQIEPDFNPNDAFRHFGLHSQLATVSMILIGRLEIFGSAGGSKEHAQFRKKMSVADLTQLATDFQSNYHFSWNVGSKAVLLQWGQTFFSADFTYFAMPSSSKSFFRFFNRLNLPLDLEKQKISLREWQVSTALSSRFFFLTPYLGITYLHSRLHVAAGPETPSINYYNEKKFGYFYGLTVSLTGRFHINLERRVRDEFAYGFSTIAVF